MVDTSVLSGSLVAKKIKDDLKSQVEVLKSVGGKPKLAIVRIGEGPSDLAYEKGITKNIKDVEIDYEIFELPVDITEDEYLNNLDELNNNEEISGILLFRPFPKHFVAKNIYNFIAEEKDVDCLNSKNLGKVFEGDLNGLVPCTPWGIIELLKYYDIDMHGKNVCIVNRSLVVGKPLSMMLLEYNATVTICHTKTELDTIRRLCKNADIVVCATGNAKMFDSSYFTPESVVIDVGMSVDENGKMSGDVDIDEAMGKIKCITPVFGGIGVVTTAALMRNTIKAETMRTVNYE